MNNKGIVKAFLIFSRVNLVIPISLVDENMSRAQKRDAVIEQKFHFRTNVWDAGTEPNLIEMSVDQIMNGDEDLRFPGLLGLVKNFVAQSEVDASTKSMLDKCKEDCTVCKRHCISILCFGTDFYFIVPRLGVKVLFYPLYFFYC
jgi:hypothetical protein